MVGRIRILLPATGGLEREPGLGGIENGNGGLLPLIAYPAAVSIPLRGLRRAH